MNKGGLALAAVLLIGGLLRLGGSGSPIIEQSAEKSSTANAEKSAGSPYQADLRTRIEDFYGVREEDRLKATDLRALFKLLESTYQVRPDQVQFVIAILPDPAHTHLGLFFDRGIEALQQAAQIRGFAFDRAILPWERNQPSEQGEGKASHEQADERTRREANPGLLIFRQANESGATSKSPLFVLIVGETPTGGLNKKQLQNAWRFITDVRGISPLVRNESAPPLLILGPSFSGSLESLGQELRQNTNETFIYSGTVTGSTSMAAFEHQLAPSAHFASFQENDDFAQDLFLQFACERGYQPDEIAILSEDGTVYGKQRTASLEKPASQESLCLPKSSDASTSPIQLHFPREISYFRSAYQKETSSQRQSTPKPTGITTLPLDLNESGNDDDSVGSYAAAQTSVSQESVMLGIMSELQKHHIKFTFLLATDPLDQLFLARYLRTAYPQGRVVVTNPDLLFTREENVLLRGVLGLNVYALVPGLSDKLCVKEDSAGMHEDRLFVSSLSVGTFNAMTGLLSIGGAGKKQWQPGSADQSEIPPAAYAEYGSPLLATRGEVYCQARPLLWLTILGRDGFWLVTGLTDLDVRSATGQEQVISLKKNGERSTLKTAVPLHQVPAETVAESSPQIPLAWNLAYWLALAMLVTHATLSLSGSMLADSEAKAQFARTADWRDSAIIALGAVVLLSALVLVLCTRSLHIRWDIPTLLFWLPVPLFMISTFWDIGRLRGHPAVAVIFLLLALFLTWYQLDHLWSRGERFLQLASGVSPVLPVLLLLGAGYWWMWQGLRGVTLVDLRRPRLPTRESLAIFSVVAYRISDTEGEELRRVAHPFVFVWQIFFPILGLALISLTVLDRKHPIQTLEGHAYDWGFSVLLGLIIATLLGPLLKLIGTWLKCRQILGGLDRLPLREAFGRLKGLSWHSFWNPGGSSLRGTYKLMALALDSLVRLDNALANPEQNSPVSAESRDLARAEIAATFRARATVLLAYSKVIPEKTSSKDEYKKPTLPHMELAETVHSNVSDWCEKVSRESRGMPDLVTALEGLQKQMASAAATLMRTVLKAQWDHDTTPMVSVDERVEIPKLPLSQTLAEEFVALVYVNFLVTVLLRMRTLVLTSVGIYVLIVLSISVYPFEPHVALQTLSVVLLLVMVAIVGYVYAEMHRDVILSKLTSTAPGELGVDFWIKFASAAAIPVFSLLAAQFPSIGQFLFSWLEPVLQAVR